MIFIVCNFYLPHTQVRGLIHNRSVWVVRITTAAVIMVISLYIKVIACMVEGVLEKIIITVVADRLICLRSWIFRAFVWDFFLTQFTGRKVTCWVTRQCSKASIQWRHPLQQWSLNRIFQCCAVFNIIWGTIGFIWGVFVTEKERMSHQQDWILLKYILISFPVHYAKYF